MICVFMRKRNGLRPVTFTHLDHVADNSGEDMDYKENINYRRSIIARVYKSEKLTDEEKWWLKSNPSFNPRFDFPCYQRDVIHIPKNRDVSVTVAAVSYGDKAKIYRPVISVVGKGAIKVSGKLLDTYNNEVDCKETRVLVTLLDENRRSTTVTALSKLGLIDIYYQCEYYDERMRLHTREMSNGANLLFGMKKLVVSDNEFLYYCKSPTALNYSTDCFNAFVFSVKIED